MGRCLPRQSPPNSSGTSQGSQQLFGIPQDLGTVATIQVILAVKSYMLLLSSYAIECINHYQDQHSLRQCGPQKGMSRYIR